MRRLWVAVDPGERWNGYAILRYWKQKWRMEAGVLDAKGYSFPQLVDTLLHDTYRSYVICESFQARRAWTKLHTVEVIGALRFATESRDATFETVMPGPPEMLHEILGATIPLMKWFNRWPDAHHAEWQHAKSAWRILGQWLLVNQLPILQAVRDMKDVQVGKYTTKEVFKREAPSLTWTRTGQLSLL